MSDQSEQVLLASYVKQRYLIILRGTILFSLSSLLLLFVVMSPGVQLMTNEYSWLPFVALLVLLLGGARVCRRLCGALDGAVFSQYTDSHHGHGDRRVHAGGNV